MALVEVLGNLVLVYCSAPQWVPNLLFVPRSYPSARALSPSVKSRTYSDIPTFYKPFCLDQRSFIDIPTYRSYGSHGSHPLDCYSASPRRFTSGQSHQKMHFAYPPRKNSTPPSFVPHSTKWAALRRRRMKVLALAGLAFVTFLYLIIRPGRGHAARKEYVPSGKPPAVLVTVLDQSHYSKAYLDEIKENRIQYAAKHGYETFFPKIGDYDLKGSPFSWTKVVAMRDTITRFPDCSYIWFLDQNSFIMNPQLTVEEHVMKASRLESLMIKDQPIVPPDSIIRTFTHLKGQDVDFVLTQDTEGLSAGSFLVRNGEWARFFLETWFDPIYRSYNFQKAEAHALEHIVQWHPTILSKLALVPQGTINSYNKPGFGHEYKPGDFAVRFHDCGKTSTKVCETEAERFTQQWRSAFSES
ncbi:galactosyl transferase GMA12/MNN10 family-domain-containing protein [Phialemonium atrogriseum]|uniref:Galactosyl transferase GMA12/MNN10 family-domain-containing protein n=1 Tax=Phialemonium atrogriseum TaxID=1093897 RepID=A0AAJ0C9M9_9PEZI|nr:galactosyl transferase GMA12/MNN10 family-domain-containing protein [Phialemonium atrogriseum]KAK1772531.1 galactosyl transferase GMA12/MNN10 family-domain-containing protein [Phialemonium atrogriseum]